jgi:phosphoglycerate dehydrogenase-like enzyme
MLNWINSVGSYEYTANMQDTVVGIIGMGDMGKMYARRISDAGWR